jgi:GNAT superfamily N-acetyltransferase
VSRFGIREAATGDADGIARAHVASWQTSYRGILPDGILDRIDVGQRAQSRREILARRSGLHLVAYDLTHGDIVGFCDAGPARATIIGGEVYAIYLLHHAKRHGLGGEMFERVKPWLTEKGWTKMIVWVLDNNHHARRFYEAMGGRAGPQKHTSVGGFPVVEQSYIWDRL